MSLNSSITFIDERGNESAAYRKNQAFMEDTAAVYTKCRVEIIAGKGAVWIVYSEERFGGAGSGVGQYRIVYPDSSGSQINVGFRIKSAQAFSVTFPCIAFFEHSDFRGFMRATDVSLEDITDGHPAGDVSGVSSAIALSGLWKIWSLKANQGTIVATVDALKKQQEVQLFQNNDKGRSVELVKA